MKDVQLISSPPSRDNLIYFLKPKHNLDELVSVLSSEFTNSAVQILKTLLEDMAIVPTSIYQWKQKLGKKLQTLLELSTFSSSGSKHQLVIATSAFGLGVDIPDHRRIIHWGLPSTKEEYVQETGRAGRDGEDAHTTLYEGKSGWQASQDMKSYTLMCQGL